MLLYLNSIVVILVIAYAVKETFLKIAYNRSYQRVNLKRNIKNDSVNLKNANVYACSYDVKRKEILPRVILVDGNNKRIKSNLIRINKDYIRNLLPGIYKISVAEALKNIKDSFN